MEEETKTCNKCNQIKEVQCFVKNKKHSGGFSNTCKDCLKERMREKYKIRCQNNLCGRCGRKSDYGIYCTDCSEKRNVNKREIHRKHKKEAIEYLGYKCCNCGLISLYMEIYDFHHTKEDKEKTITQLLNGSLDKVKLELDKCQLICSNCHRNFHSDKMLENDGQENHESDILCRSCGKQIAYGKFCRNCLTSREKRRKELYRQRKEKIVESLGGKCQICKLTSNNVEVYDFHHTGDDKEKTISWFLEKSFDKIKPELDKCQLVCANCHRIIHSTGKGK